MKTLGLFKGHSLSLGLALLSFTAFAYAETEPPFIPSVTFESVSLPNKQAVGKIDLKTDSAMRAKEMRTSWQGLVTPWTSIGPAIIFPIQVTKDFVGQHDVSIQFRDAQKKQSAWAVEKIEVLPFEYLQREISTSGSGRGCWKDSSGYLNIKRQLTFDIPKDLDFEVRTIRCSSSASGTVNCPYALKEELQKQAWVRLPADHVLEISERFFDLACYYVSVYGQFRDNHGFVSEPVLLPMM